MTITLAILLVISVVLNVVLGIFVVKIGKATLRMESALETCLDELDVSYAKIGRILRMPLVSDDPQVTQIHKEMKNSQELLLRVANKLTSEWNSTKED